MNNIFDDTMPASLNILPMYAQSDYSGKSFLYENFDYFTVKIQRSKRTLKHLYISENQKANADNFYVVPGNANTVVQRLSLHSKTDFNKKRSQFFFLLD